MGVLNPPIEVPQMDGVEPEPSLGEPDERMDDSNQLSQDLQGSFDQAEHEEELPQEVHPYLGKLEQETNLVCPESIQEPGEEVDGLILYQTVEEEEETMENSLDADTLMGNAPAEFVQEGGIPENPREDGPTDLADQVDEISEGQMDHVSLLDVPVVQTCDETSGKALKQLDVKHNKMELDSMYSDYSESTCLAASVSSPAAASKSDETTTQSGCRAQVKTEVSMDQESFEGAAEDLSLPDGSRDCKNGALTFSLDQDNKDNLLEQNEIKAAPILPTNSVDRKPTDLKFPLLPDSGGEEKPEQLELPIKVEETKTEAAEDVYPDSSEVKHGKFFSYAVKSEDLVTKAEQLDYPVKPESLETKPEDLSLPMKPESLDSKPEVLQFAADSDGAEIKPEAKPVALGFAAYPDVAKLKTETKQEGLEFTTYPDSSEIKPEAKPEALEFRVLPEIKAETKQELLEADSTVLTPKLEQTDGLVDTSGGLVVKGQVKEERPTTPGESPSQRLMHIQEAANYYLLSNLLIDHEIY